MKDTSNALTLNLIFTKTKTHSLQSIKNLNLWGNNLEDLSLLEKMPNLEIISLSVNRISSLKYFSTCSKLHELYLRKNNICDLKEIGHIMHLPFLKVLWLYDNPCAGVKNYREIVIKHLSHLIKLDNNSVTPQERATSNLINFLITVPQIPQIPQREIEIASNNLHSQIQQSPNQFQQTQLPPIQRPPQPSSAHSSKKYSIQQSISPKNSQNTKHVSQNKQREEEIAKNQNILIAVLSLVRELDSDSLQIIKNEIEKRL